MQSCAVYVRHADTLARCSSLLLSRAHPVQPYTTPQCVQASAVYVRHAEMPWHSVPRCCHAELTYKLGPAAEVKCADVVSKEAGDTGLIMQTLTRSSSLLSCRADI
jgi:hypothetical protein